MKTSCNRCSDLEDAIKSMLKEWIAECKLTPNALFEVEGGRDQYGRSYLARQKAQSLITADDEKG